MMTPEEITQNRWRLVLGKQAEDAVAFHGNTREVSKLRKMEDLLDYLYSRAGGEDVRSEGSSGRMGGTGSSALKAADWITKVRTLFPQQTAEILEKQALEEFGMTELLTDKQVLEQITPDIGLLKTILQLKHLMRGEVLETAKHIAARIAEDLRQKLENSVRRSILGRIDRSQASVLRSARNLDIRKTIRRNLRHYDPERGQLVLEEVYFSSRVKRCSNRRIIIAVDESGSMVGSVIYAAVMAQILSKLPFADVRLVIFDTNVVDLSGHAEDPAEVLMSVQLSGGTNISKALRYCESLVEIPQKATILCVTDLYEGVPERHLLTAAQSILSSGIRLNFLTALDENASPAYDRELGQKLADMGAFVGALTPEQLGVHLGKLFS